MMLETVLLLMEDGIAVVGLIYLLSATNEVIVRTNNASCPNVNASDEGTVTGCVTTTRVPEIFPKSTSAILSTSNKLLVSGAAAWHPPPTWLAR